MVTMLQGSDERGYLLFHAEQGFAVDLEADRR
jgi:hypothetical protein